MSDERTQRVTPELSAALNRIAAALERLVDVYLYVNDPDEEGEPPQSLTLPDGFKGTR